MRSKKQLTWQKSHSRVTLASWKKSGVTTLCPWSRLSRRCRTRLTPVLRARRLRLPFAPASGKLHLTCSPTNPVRYPGHTSSRLPNSRLRLNSLHRPKSCSMKPSVYTKHSKCISTIKSMTMHMNLRPETCLKAKLSHCSVKMRRNSNMKNVIKKQNNYSWKWKKLTKQSRCNAMQTSGRTWSNWRSSSGLTCWRTCRCRLHLSSRRTATNWRPNSARLTAACGWTQ